MVASATIALLAGLVLAPFSLADSNNPYSKALELTKGIRPRELKAASLVSNLAKRKTEINLRHSVILHYIDDGSDFDGAIPLGARVELSSHRPTLLLEEIEHILGEVHCEGLNGEVESTIELQLHEHHFSEAWKVLEEYDEFLIITSHYSCNQQGSRLPYLASACTYRSDINTIRATLTPVEWKSEYAMSVSFGKESTEGYMPNRHEHLRRRAVGSTAMTTIMPSAASTGPLSSATVSSLATLSSAAVTFPIPSSTNIPSSVTSAVGSVATSYVNTNILPPDAVAGSVNGLSIGGISLPPGLKVQCLNCTTYGNVTVTEGSFSMNATNGGGGDSSKVSDPFGGTIGKTDGARTLGQAFKNGVDFIQNGFVAMSATGLGAHVELSTLWPAAVPPFSTFAITLATIPLQPFSIPNIAVVGPVFTPRLLLSAALSADLNFTYGFEMTVPDESVARASIGNVTNSTITGFENTNFTALPFSAAISNPALNLSATLQPELLIGVSLLNGGASAGAGVFLNLPRLSLEVKPVMGVDASCNPSTDKAVTDPIASQFGNLTNLIPSVEIAGGFIAQAQVGIVAEQTAWTPLATTFPAPTACLAFDKSKSSFVPATAAATTATAAASSSSAAAASLHPGWDGGFRIDLRILGVVLGGIMVGAALL